MSSRRWFFLLLLKQQKVMCLYWAPGGGDVVLLQPNIKPNRNFGYVFRSPFVEMVVVCNNIWKMLLVTSVLGYFTYHWHFY
jgi:hypothetical protein